MDQFITGKTQLAALFAEPASHSISPSMHNLAFQLTDINAVYLAFEVGENTLKQAIEAVRSFHMLGVNLSMPNKVLALNYVDEISETAKLSGSINTIINNQGKLLGDNTDGLGFLQSLKIRKISILQKKMTILGIGGAAMALIAQTALVGIKEIAIYNRPKKTEELTVIQQKVKQIAKQTGCQITINNINNVKKLQQDLSESLLLINATNVGMSPLENQTLIDSTLLPKHLIVYDLIYQPKETRLLKEAKLNGNETINGFDMLFYQGAAAFKKWTNQDMPVEKIRTLLGKNT